MGVFTLESLKGLDFIQTAYVGKDNPISVVLKEDGVEYDYSTAKTVRCKIGAVTLDSDSDATNFDRTEAETGKLQVFIGDQNIEPKTYNVKVEIVTVDDHVFYFGHVKVRVENPGI